VQQACGDCMDGRWSISSVAQPIGKMPQALRTGDALESQSYAARDFLSAWLSLLTFLATHVMTWIALASQTSYGGNASFNERALRRCISQLRKRSKCIFGDPHGLRRLLRILLALQLHGWWVVTPTGFICHGKLTQPSLSKVDRIRNQT